MTIRTAKAADIPALTALIDQAIGVLLGAFLSPEQVAASRSVMGLDTQLIADTTYFVAELDGLIVGCGGWSRRATPYGGDHSGGRDARPLDPSTEAAKVRAMYTRPGYERRGIGRMILAHCEAAARIDGFRRAELSATLAGEPLYRAAGYQEIRRFEDLSGEVAVPLLLMTKSFDP